MINYNINYTPKDILEVEKIFTLFNNNKLVNKISINNVNTGKNDICKKCNSKMRFVKSRNGKFKDFFTCDTCNPIGKNDFKINNENNIPDYIHCPQCSNIINKKVSSYGAYYKCSCGFKVDGRSKNLFNYI